MQIRAATEPHVSRRRKRELSFSTPAKKLRTTSAPASCSARPSTGSSGVHAVPRVSRYRSGWRNGNRWSALASSSPSSSSEESRTLDKGKARSQESLELALESLLAYGLGASEENKWPDSTILKESMLASLAIAGKTPATTSSLSSAVSEMQAASAGNARMRGSLLSAASRVRLRDLARQARCAVVAPLVNASSTSVQSSSSTAAIVEDDSGSGPLATSVSGATSSHDSGLHDCDSVPSSGSDDPSASFSDGLSAVVDIEKACLDNDGNADVSNASGELAAAMPALIRPSGERCSLVVGDSTPMSTSHGASLTESVLLLPTLSDFDLHFLSKAMDERAHLVIASQEDGKPEPTGEGEAIVRLKASSRRASLPESSPHSRHSTAPSALLSGPAFPPASARPSYSPGSVSRRRALLNEAVSNFAQAPTIPNVRKFEQQFSPPAFAHHRRATTSVGTRMQDGFSPRSELMWRRRDQS